MIITKEGEEYQSLLRKVEYLENVIRYSKYYAGCDLIEEKTPEFKIGQWVVRTVGKKATGHELGRIFRIDRMDSKSQIYADDGTFHFASSLRKAKINEIREYLFGEAWKRGFVNEFRFVLYGYAKYTRKKDYFADYNSDDDSLLVNVKEVDCPVAIYHQGTWATLVKEKKELPKTKEQLFAVLDAYYVSGRSTSDFVNDFMD
jgi:hypothetical protein